MVVSGLAAMLHMCHGLVCDKLHLTFQINIFKMYSLFMAKSPVPADKNLV